MVKNQHQKSEGKETETGCDFIFSCIQCGAINEVPASLLSLGCVVVVRGTVRNFSTHLDEVSSVGILFSAVSPVRIFTILIFFGFALEIRKINFERA